jgi:hypothetical protein
VATKQDPQPLKADVTPVDINAPLAQKILAAAAAAAAPVQPAANKAEFGKVMVIDGPDRPMKVERKIVKTVHGTELIVDRVIK